MGVASLAGGDCCRSHRPGGFSQSAVNLRSGARSQLAGLVTAVLAVAVAMFLAPLLDDLPEAVLAAMVLVAILGLLDPHDFARYARIDRAEMWVAIAVTGLCLTGGMLLGVAAGVALTLVLVVRQVNRPRVRPLYRREGGGWTTLPPDDGGEVAGMLLLHVDGPIYTGNAQVTLDSVVEAALVVVPPVHSVVLEASAVHRVTVPMLDGLRSLQQELATEGFTLRVAGVPPERWRSCAATRGSWTPGGGVGLRDRRRSRGRGRLTGRASHPPSHGGPVLRLPEPDEPSSGRAPEGNRNGPVHGRPHHRGRRHDQRRRLRPPGRPGDPGRLRRQLRPVLGGRGGGRSSASSRPRTPRPPRTVDRGAHGLVADEIYAVAEGA